MRRTGMPAAAASSSTVSSSWGRAAGCALTGAPRIGSVTLHQWCNVTGVTPDSRQEQPVTDAFVYDAVRTPRGKGKPTGALHTVKPVDLISGLLDAVRERNPELDASQIDDIVLGCVGQVGDQGGVIARTAAIKAGMPEGVAGTTLNRYCGSGLEGVNQA